MAPGSKSKAKQLYFTRHDQDLWEAIQALPKGDQNHEIRKALRHWFLGEASGSAPAYTEIQRTVSTAEPEKKVKKEAEDGDEAVSKLPLPFNMIK